MIPTWSHAATLEQRDMFGVCVCLKIWYNDLQTSDFEPTWWKYDDDQAEFSKTVSGIISLVKQLRKKFNGILLFFYLCHSCCSVGISGESSCFIIWWSYLGIQVLWGSSHRNGTSHWAIQMPVLYVWYGMITHNNPSFIRDLLIGVINIYQPL